LVLQREKAKAKPFGARLLKNPLMVLPIIVLPFPGRLVTVQVTVRTFLIWAKLLFQSSVIAAQKRPDGE
jgi:hypothetical protein